MLRYAFIANRACEVRGTVALESINRINAYGAVFARRRRAVINVVLTLGARESNRTNATKIILQVDASCAIKTGRPCTLIHINLAACARESLVARTRKATNSVTTSAAIFTRRIRTAIERSAQRLRNAPRAIDLANGGVRVTQYETEITRKDNGCKRRAQA
jgi:hypothetical protein